MNLSRLFQVAALDFRHNLKRPLFWMLILILGLTAWLLAIGDMRISSGDSTVGGTKAWLTSEFAVAQTLTYIVFLFYAFFIAVAAGMTVIHDDGLKVGEILHSTPLRPSEYFWGKFLAVSMSFLGILTIHLLMVMFFNHIFPNPAADEIRGPFALINYLRPTLLLALPTIFFLTATAFAVGVWTRKPILIFVLPVGLVLGSAMFLWEWSPSWLDPNTNRILMVLDVSGFRWLYETWLKVDRGVDFYNTAPMGFDGTFLLNRLMLILGGVGALFLSLWHFSRQLRGEKVSSKAARKAREATVAPAAAAAAAVSSQSVPATAALGKVGETPGIIRGAGIVARAELKELRSQAGLYLFIPLILMQVIGQALYNTGAFNTPVLVTSGYFAVGMMNTLTLAVSLVLMFYTVESLEREKKDGLASIYLATPIRTASSFLGKAAANGVIALVILISVLILSVIVLLVQATTPVELRPFMLVWGVLLLPTFMVWSAFVMAIHALTNNRYTTYAIALVALIFTGYKQAVNEMNWVGNWDIWGVLVWSDMGTFEIDGMALIFNRIMVLGLTGLFAAMTLRFFARAERDASRTGARLRPLSLLKGALRLSPYALVPLATGIALFVQVQNGFEGAATEKKQKDYWRRNLATWREALYPSLADVNVDLELKPEKRWFRTKGSYMLVNRHESELRQVPLTRGLHWQDMAWTMDGRDYEPEDHLGLMIFTPDEPLAPGDSLEIGFAHEGTMPKGVSKNGGESEEFILPSGVVLTGFTPSFVPVVGYSEEIGIDDENRYESREYADDFYEGITQPGWGGGDRATTRIRVTGPEDYTYNSVGTKQSEEVVDGRRTTVWESDYPVYFFNVVAGRWDVHRGAGTSIYYHPGHDYNIEEIGEALEAARLYYSKWFMEFPWQELKLSEFPALATYAQGFPTNITFSEALGFLTKDDPRANAPFMVTAHEAAHQWWGNILLPGDGPGGNILSEGMSHFSTILLFEQVKGPHQRIEFCKRIEENYGDTRRVDSERPLVKIDGSKTGDVTVTYDKGGWVFWMLMNHMGRERALAGIQEFIRNYSNGPDYPVLQDFVAEMRPFAPDTTAYDEFVDQWFFDVVVPHYRLANAERVQNADGWQVTVEVTNAGTGTMPVEVAATRGERFPDDESDDEPEKDPNAAELASTEALEPDDEEPEYKDVRKLIVLGPGGSKTVTLECPFEPEQVLMDPDALVLQLYREQAIVEF
jgi:ABC-type transport system involved in multi-copper enzyme maturation permease subunit